MSIVDQAVLVIIPCYNEEISIGPLLEEIKACGMNYATIVIDDGSKDDTFMIANQVSPTIRLLKNLGIGGSVQMGVMYAERNDFDFCVQIDGDGQHPPSEIAKLLNAFRENPCSIIIGSRYLLHDTFRSTWARRFGSQMISKTIHYLFHGCNVTDPTSGMRLMDRKAIKLFASRYPHDFPEPISLVWALSEGLSVAEVPVQMREREYGRSSIIGFKPIAYMFRVISYIILARVVLSTRCSRGRD